jgi:hypothetical protein
MIFAREGDLLAPTDHARGPWDPGALHGGAPSALVARAAEALAPDMRIARLTVEFLGAVPLAPLSVEAQIVKPASASRSWRRPSRSRRPAAPPPAAAWCCCAAATSPTCRRATGRRRCRRDPSAPGAATGAGLGRLRQLGDGHPLHGRRLHAGGPATAWFRLALPLVQGETPSAAQRAVAAADFGNGISRVLDWGRWLFVNTDLTVHLHREPEGEWVALDARTDDRARRVRPGRVGPARRARADRRGTAVPVRGAPLASEAQMARVYDEIDEHWAGWIARQAMFFVGTAPLDATRT